MRHVVIIGSGPTGHTAGICVGLSPPRIASTVEVGDELIRTTSGHHCGRVRDCGRPGYAELRGRARPRDARQMTVR